MAATTLVCLAVLILVNYFVCGRKMLYPPLLFCSVWFVDVALYLSLASASLPEVHTRTWQLILAGAVAFTMGGLLSFLVPRFLFYVHPKALYADREPANNLARIVMLCIVGLCLLAVVREAIALGSAAGSFSLEQVRSSEIDAVVASQTGLTENVASYICPEIATAVTLCLLIQKRDRWFWASFFLSCLTFLAATGRTPFLKLFSAALSIELIRGKQEYLGPTLRKVAIPAIVFIGLFTGIIFLNKDLSSFNGDILGIVAFYVVGYFLCALVPLDTVVSSPAFFYGEPNRTFRFFNIFLNQIGFDLPVKPVVQDYMWITFNGVPFPTNVYTVYKFYFVDFGFAGALVVMVILGFALSVLYRKAQHHGRLSLLLSSIFVFPILLAFFDDTFLQFRTVLVFTGIAIFYFSFLNRIRIYPDRTLRLSLRIFRWSPLFGKRLGHHS